MATLVSRLREGLGSFFHVSSPQRLAREMAGNNATERFREALLGLLSGTERTERTRLLQQRIRYAIDLQALWFMRGEVAAVLARMLGEAEALHRVERESAAVRDALPGGLRSRPSPLARAH
jgi:hypothetical protein